AARALAAGAVIRGIMRKRAWGACVREEMGFMRMRNGWLVWLVAAGVGLTPALGRGQSGQGPAAAAGVAEAADPGLANPATGLDQAAAADLLEPGELPGLNAQAASLSLQPALLHTEPVIFRAQAADVPAPDPVFPLPLGKSRMEE